jgi:Mn-dependent DtxR family transcriptional regulator
MKKHSVDFSESLEDYLEAVRMLGGEKVKSIDIATQIGVTKASVNHAVNLLIEAGYVDKEPYGTISLTEEGRRVAERVLRRHMTLKAFLKDTLGLEEEQADKEACGIEHHVSDETIRRLENWIETCKQHQS